jgi:hypothetical protein
MAGVIHYRISMGLISVLARCAQDVRIPEQAVPAFIVAVVRAFQLV